MLSPLAAWCVVLLATAAAAPDGYYEGGVKSRGIPGMFPKPFVGRSNPGATWLVDVSDLADIDAKTKRGEISGLFAYPRVGRSGSDSGPEPIEAEDKRGAALTTGAGRYHGSVKRDGDGNNGLWFGPRLGRSQKRTEEVQPESPWALIALREYPPSGRRQDTAFTPRLGRESGEEFTDDYDAKHLHAEHV